MRHNMGFSQSEWIGIIRILVGGGDIIMARNAIINSIKQRPNTHHTLYMLTQLKPLVSDIKDLEVITVIGNSIKERSHNAKLLAGDKHDVIVSFDNICIEQEIKEMPDVKNSRHEIFCRALDVEYTKEFNVNFSGEEHEWANHFIKDLPKPIIGLHLWSAMDWRTYPYPKWFIHKIAKNIDGTVITVDKDFRYKGFHKNVVSLFDIPIRKTWAVMSKMDVGIGVDSFGCHAWLASGVPVYGLFGCTDPKRFMNYKTKHAWMPLTKHCPKGGRCWYNICHNKKDTMPESPTRCLLFMHPRKVWPDIVNQMEIQDWVKGKSKSIDKGIIKDTGTEFSFVSRLPTKKVTDKIAVVLGEGLGGSTMVSDVAKKIYDKLGMKSVVFVRNFPELFYGNPYIDSIELIKGSEPDECIEHIRPSFDIVCGLKTGIGKWFINEDYPDKLYQTYDWDNIKKYYNDYPDKLYELEKFKLNFIQLADMSLGLRYNTVENYIYHLSKVDGLPYHYVAVSNGVDADHGGVKQTKCWPHKYWEDFVRLCDIPVVQFGTNFDKRIKGAVDFRNKTSVSQFAYGVANSDLVFAQEGGLMHIAHAVRHRDVVVVRGPTVSNMFRYSGHICIDAINCNGCYWKTNLWWRDCPKNIDAACMKSIDPELVANVVNNKLRGRPS